MKTTVVLWAVIFALSFTSCGDMAGFSEPFESKKVEEGNMAAPDRRASNIDPKFRNFESWGLIAFKGKLFRIGGIRDGKNFPVNEVWESADGFRWEERTPKSDAVKDAMVKKETLFEPRREMAVFEAQNRLYLFGGWYDTGNRLEKIFRAGFGNDLWTSQDGTEWELAKNNDVLKLYNISDVKNSAVVTYADRNDEGKLINRNVLIIGGGEDYSNSSDKVWGFQVSHANTISDLKPAKIPNPRQLAAAIRFNGNVYVIGGVQDYAYGLYTKNMLTSDDDGTTWKKNAYPKSTSGDISSDLLHRADHQAVVFQNRIFVIGGYRGSGSGVDQHGKDDPIETLKDVWSSADGENWEREGEIATLPDYFPDEGHYYYRAVVFDGKIFVVGEDRTWISEDGKTWTNGPQMFVE